MYIFIKENTLTQIRVQCIGKNISAYLCEKDSLVVANERCLDSLLPIVATGELEFLMMMAGTSAHG